MLLAYYTELASDDFLEIIIHTRLQFGQRASHRYSALIEQAVLDLAVDPHRAGSMPMDNLGNGIHFYHIRHSKKSIRKAADRVVHPRHIIAYRLIGTTQLQVIRIVHDMRLHEKMRYLNRGV